MELKEVTGMTAGVQYKILKNTEELQRLQRRMDVNS